MCSSRVPKFLSTSIFDFSVITNPNRVIFDSTDRSLSLLSKNTIFPNFSPQFIVQFDQILKDISKIPKFPVDSTRIYHYTPQFSLNSPKLVSSVLFLTRDRVKSTTSRSRLVSTPHERLRGPVDTRGLLPRVRVLCATRGLATWPQRRVASAQWSRAPRVSSPPGPLATSAPAGKYPPFCDFL